MSMILFEATSTETQKGKVEDLYAALTLKSMSDYSSLPPFFPLRLSYEFFLFCKVKVSDRAVILLRSAAEQKI